MKNELANWGRIEEVRRTIMNNFDEAHMRELVQRAEKVIGRVWGIRKRMFLVTSGK